VNLKSLKDSCETWLYKQANFKNISLDLFIKSALRKRLRTMFACSNSENKSIEKLPRYYWTKMIIAGPVQASSANTTRQYSLWVETFERLEPSIYLAQQQPNNLLNIPRSFLISTCRTNNPLAHNVTIYSDAREERTPITIEDLTKIIHL
jgi:hypothetical protein